MWCLSVQPSTQDGLNWRRTRHFSDTNALGQSLTLVTRSEPWETMAPSDPTSDVGGGHHTCHRSSGMREYGFTYMGSSPAMVWTHLGLGRTAHNKVGSPSTLQCWSQLSIKILLSLFWLLWAFIFHDITWLWISLAPQTLCNITVLAIQTRISDGTNNLSWLTWTSFLGLVRFV